MDLKPVETKADFQGSLLPRTWEIGESRLIVK